MTMKRTVKITVSIIVLAVLVYFQPIPTLAFIGCGIYDVSRNPGLNWDVIKRYFTGNGPLTWLTSPLNTLLDIFALPFINKGVYQLSDLPKKHQAEIRELLEYADGQNLPDLLANRVSDAGRTMFFFKWYGKDVESFIDFPGFQKKRDLIKTIGVSVFKGRESTSRHFGPFRPTLRVLYCLSDVQTDDVYIKVGNLEHKWRENRLFIFDDTMLHQSVNNADELRYCLFVDILRPTYLKFVMNFAVFTIRTVFKGFNGIFYKNWKMVTN